MSTVVDISVLRVNNDINNACKKNSEMLVSIAQQCIPLKDIWVRPRDKLGMTPAIRKLFRQCKRFHKKATRTGRADHFEQFRVKRQKAEASFRLSRNNFYNNVVTT